jgi:hypothetical protein
MDYKENNIRRDRGKGRGAKRARVTRVRGIPKHGKRKHTALSIDESDCDTSNQALINILSQIKKRVDSASVK